MQTSSSPIALQPQFIVTPTDQAGALEFTESIKRELARSDEAFIAAAIKIKQACDAEIWIHLGRRNKTEYFELDLQISDSVGYDLEKIGAFVEQYPELRNDMIGTGIAKIRQLMPDLQYDRRDKTFALPEPQAAQLLRDASTKSTRQLRDELTADDEDDDPEEYSAACPHCHATLVLDKPARVLSAKAVRTVKLNVSAKKKTRN